MPVTVTSAPAKTGTPFIKWAGGKTQLLPELRKYFPVHFGTYIEPFVGGGAVFFDLAPRKAVLNDTNEELIHAYRTVQNDVERLIDTLEEFAHSEENFYRIREQKPLKLSGVMRAARFLYLNKTCFNGLYRVNKAGQFNVPFGRYSSPTICNPEKLRAASEALQGVTLLCTDYKTVLKEHAKKGDFLYVDPPYHPVSKFSDFKRYTKDYFEEQQQEELHDLLLALKKRGCSVVASNSHCDFILDLYKDFDIITVDARRFINSDSSKRLGAKEVILL